MAGSLASCQLTADVLVHLLYILTRWQLYSLGPSIMPVDAQAQVQSSLPLRSTESPSQEAGRPSHPEPHEKKYTPLSKS